MKELMNKPRILSKRNIISNQDGFAAFAVTMLIMIVLSLIVLGFAANARRSQTNALNNQLSTAAYYAAQSGINNAINVISSEINSNQSLTPQSTCNPPSSIYNQNNISNLSSNTTYSCLLVNPAPPSLEYRPINNGQSEIIPLISSSTIKNITVSWKTPNSTSVSSCPPSSGTLLSVSNYPSSCPAVLQLDIMPNNSKYFATMATNNLTTSFFLQPVSSSSSPTSTPTLSSNSIIPVQCVNNVSSGSSYEYNCGIKLNLASLPYSSNGQFYMRLTPFYNNANVSIKAYSGTGTTTSLNLSHAQTLIDSTGRSGNVLKRLQVRICSSNYCNSAIAPGAIESTNGICKHFSGGPSNTKGFGIGAPSSGTNC